MITNDARALQNLACSAGVFFARANFCRQKSMLKLEKRGENGASQKERGKGREGRRENAYPKTLCKWETRAGSKVTLNRRFHVGY